MRDRDPLGYYAALNIGPDASRQEIRLAWEFVKNAPASRQAKIREAYAVLIRPERRQLYDSGRMKGARPLVPRELRKHLNSVAVLAVLLLVFGTIILYGFGDDLRAGLTSFSPGDELAWNDGTPLGTVLAYEGDHVFPSGVRGAGYQVRPADGGEDVWYPASDLKRHGKRR